MNIPKFTTEETEKFWSKVAITDDPDACWEWIGYRLPRGYGIYYISSIQRTFVAHRIAYTLANSEIVSGLYVCHKCDNPPCCNPKHLFLGTQSENMKDAVRKGRLHSLYDYDLAHKTKCQGEENPNAKLTWEKVRQIRKLWLEGEISQTELAKRFGVNSSHIKNIILNKRWIE